jgi:pimeloyl-ACP methyl ester carboxylesterase
MTQKTAIFFTIALALFAFHRELTSTTFGEEELIRKTGFIDVGKTQLYYEEMGQGHPLIMMHGGLLDRRMWDDQFEIFAKMYRVVRFDVRNHGDSKGIPDTFKHYEDLRKVLSQLNIEKAAIMGLSLGGRIAIDFAIAYPENTSAIILAAPGASGYEFKSEAFQKNNEKLEQAFAQGDIKRGIEYFQQAWTDGPHRDPSQVDQSVREKVKNMALNTLQDWESRSIMNELEPPAIGRLDEIQAPTLAVVGDLDMPGILAIVDLVIANVSGAKKVIIPGAAHMVNMEKPEEFNRIVLDFLENLDL